MKFQELWEKYWEDVVFRRELQREPRRVLREYGVDIPENADVVVHEDEVNARHFVLSDAKSDIGNANTIVTEALFKANDDREFRCLLLADPKRAMKDHFDVILPESFRVHIHEDTPERVHVVIPAKPSEELSDLDLDLVAGGKGFSFGPLFNDPGTPHYYGGPGHKNYAGGSPFGGVLRWGGAW